MDLKEYSLSRTARSWTTTSTNERSAVALLKDRGLRIDPRLPRGLAEVHKPEIAHWDPVGGDVPCILQDQT